MILLTESPVDKLFSDGRLAIVEFDHPEIKLTFDKPMRLSPRNVFDKDDFISAEILTHGELTSFLKDIRAKSLPFEVHTEDQLRDIVERIQSI